MRRERIPARRLFLSLARFEYIFKPASFTEAGCAWALFVIENGEIVVRTVT
jgi:hypothetical protein